MRTRSDAFFDVLTGQDLHDHEFYLAHYHPTDHVSLTIPLSKRGHRTVHLAAAQCQILGHHLLRFARTRQLTEPQAPEDFQI